MYKVSYPDRTGALTDLVVRISYSGNPGDCAQAEREARAMQLTAGVAAPVLYDCRCTSPWFATPAMCMQFVPGHQRDLPSCTATEIEGLGSILAWVHGRPTDDLVQGPTPADLRSYGHERLQSIMATLQWVRDPLPLAVQTGLREAADTIRRRWERGRDAQGFESGQTLALLHGDLGPGNILWGPDPVLIDWEYTRLGDPADEIGYFFDQNDLAADQRHAFWRRYRDGVGRPELLADMIDRVAWWEPVTLLGSALWWVERWVRRAGADDAGTADTEVPRDVGYYAERVTSRLDRLSRMLR